MLLNSYSYLPELFLAAALLIQLYFSSVKDTINIETFRDNLLLCTIIVVIMFVIGDLYAKSLLSIFMILLVIVISKSSQVDNTATKEGYIITLIAYIASLLIIDTESLLGFYLLIEVQALSLYVLVAKKRENLFSVEGGIKYFVSGAFFSAIFLLGAGGIYFAVGSVELNQLSDLLNNNLTGSLGTVLSISILLITVQLLFKIASAPFHSWMPDVYEGAPLTTTIILAILPKLPIILFLIKWFIAIHITNLIALQDLLLIFAMASTVIGTVYAINQLRTKRMFLFSTIAQIGFVVAGLTNEAGTTSVLFFVVLYLMTALIVWSHIAIVQDESKHDSDVSAMHLTNFTKTVTTSTVWLVALTITLFSIAGIPPFAGFVGKFLILDNLITDHKVVTATLLLFVSSVSVYYYLRLLKLASFETFSVNSLPIINKPLISFNLQSNLVYEVIVLLLVLLVYLFLQPDTLWFTLTDLNLVGLAVFPVTLCSHTENITSTPMTIKGQTMRLNIENFSVTVDTFDGDLDHGGQALAFGNKMFVVPNSVFNEELRSEALQCTHAINKGHLLLNRVLPPIGQRISFQGGVELRVKVLMDANGNSARLKFQFAELGFNAAIGLNAPKSEGAAQTTIRRYSWVRRAIKSLFPVILSKLENPEKLSKSQQVLVNEAINHLKLGGPGLTAQMTIKVVVKGSAW